MSEKNKALIKTLLTSGIAVVLSYLINFFLTPFITDTAGTEAYGFVTLAKTAVNYISIITVAFTAFIVRYITLAYHRKKYEEANAYYSSSILAVFGLSLVVLFIAIVVIIFMPHILTVPNNLILAVRILFLLVFANFCITTITVPFTATYYINNTLSYYNAFRALSYVIEAATLILLFSVFPTRIWYVGIGLMAASATIFAGSVIMSKKRNPELRFNRREASLTKVRTLAQNGIWQSINSLGTTLNNGLDLLISNEMLSSLVMGQLSITKNICMIFSVMYSTISQAFQPRLLKAYASNDKMGFLKELKLAMRVSGFFSSCTFAGFLALGRLYYKLWIPNQDYNFIYILTVISVFSGVVEGVIYPTYYVNTLTTKKKIPCLVTVTNGLLNVISMYFLITYTDLGAYAVILTTVVLAFINSIGFSAIYCPVTLKLPWYSLYSTIIRHLMGCAVMCIAFMVVQKITHPTNWIALIVSAVIMVIVGAFLYALLVTNLSEKRTIAKKLLNRVV